VVAENGGSLKRICGFEKVLNRLYNHGSTRNKKK
jgi:hypothetical protein